jgi:hypothetical protein
MYAKVKYLLYNKFDYFTIIKLFKKKGKSNQGQSCWGQSSCFDDTLRCDAGNLPASSAKCCMKIYLFFFEEFMIIFLKK